MNSHVDFEDALQQLGRDWPTEDSIVEGVLRGLDSLPAPSTQKAAPALRWSRRRVLLVAASVAACAALWWSIPGNRSVYAQTRDAILRARSFQMTTRHFAPQGDGIPQSLTMAYERGVGFREEWPDEMSIGNQEGAWHYIKRAKRVVKTRGPGISHMVDRFLDQELGRFFANVRLERYRVRDQEVNGQACQAFLMTNPIANGVVLQDTNRQRSIVLMDNRSRIVRAIFEVRSGDQWKAEGDIELTYDMPLDPALFLAEFPEDVRVVDADLAFEQFVDLEHVIHREERNGLWYAIHHAERFENGGLFFVTSVRGTEATLKKFPLTERPLTRGKIFIDGPADQYPGSQDPRVSGHVIQLAGVDHKGINVSWWVLIPFVPANAAALEVEGGKVRVPAVFNPRGRFGKEVFTDANGVTHPVAWEIQLPLPKPEEWASLDTISKRVYADLEAFEGVPFKFPNMRYRGLMLVHFDDLSKISATQFAEAIADEVQWWKNGAPMDDPRAVELRGPAQAK